MSTDGNSLSTLIAESVLLEGNIATWALNHYGEINPAMEQYYEEVKSLRADRVDAYKFVIDRLGVGSDLLRKQAEQFIVAAKALEEAESRIKENMKIGIKTLGADEISGKQWRFKLSEMKPKLVLSPKFQEELPPQYLIIKTIYEADKERLRAHLEQGAKIPGAQLENVYALRSYINKGEQR